MGKSLVGLAITPLLAYPTLAVCLLVADAWRGERWLSYYLRYEQRSLWDTFWADYAAATPIMYPAVAAAVVLFLVIRRLSAARPSALYVAVILSALGWCAAVLVTGRWVGAGHLALALAGGIVGVPAGVFTGGLLRQGPTER